MSEPSGKAYGEGRVRMNVSYGEVERAAIAILKSERRPTVDTVRAALGRGSLDTIGGFLKRVWRDLGARMEGDPAALTRMPAEIAELADGLWQRALKLASEAAKNDDNAARQRLEQIQLENDLKGKSFALREKEWDTATRERERALADSREHLLLTLKTLGREQVALQARDARIADLAAQVEQYRRQIATMIASAVATKRAARQKKAAGRVSTTPVRRQSTAIPRTQPGKSAKVPRKPVKRMVKVVRGRKTIRRPTSRRSR